MALNYSTATEQRQLRKMQIDMMLVATLFLVTTTVHALSDAKNQNTSTLKEFIAGAIAGVTEILVTQPLVVASVRMKLMENPPSLLSLWMSIIKKEGFKGLYKGLTANIACVIPWRSVRFASYYVLRSYLTGGNPANATLFQQAISAVITGVFETFVITPFDVIQISQIADQERIVMLFSLSLTILHRNLYTKGIGIVQRAFTGEKVLSKGGIEDLHPLA
jgi:hypothetical protein